MEPNGSLNAPTITLIDYHNLENIIPGFKFINKPCNPCLALNNHADYSCPFSLKTADNPSGQISGVWNYLWNITPTHNPLKSEPSTVASTKYVNKNKFPLLKDSQSQTPSQTQQSSQPPSQTQQSSQPPSQTQSQPIVNKINNK